MVVLNTVNLLLVNLLYNRVLNIAVLHFVCYYCTARLCFVVLVNKENGTCNVCLQVLLLCFYLYVL